MTTAGNGQIRRVELPDLAPADANAQARPRARAREENQPPAVTVGELPAARPPVTGVVAAAFAKALSGGSLVHASPPSLAEAHTRHLHAAGAFGAPLLRWARLAWAYLVHLPVKTASHVLDWLLESPARAVVAALLVLAAWHWS